MPDEDRMRNFGLDEADIAFIRAGDPQRNPARQQAAELLGTLQFEQRPGDLPFTAPTPTPTTTNEEQVQETGRVPDVQGQPPVQAPEGQAQERAAQREGQGPQEVTTQTAAGPLTFSFGLDADGERGYVAFDFDDTLATRIKQALTAAGAKRVQIFKRPKAGGANLVYSMPGEEFMRRLDFREGTRTDTGAASWYAREADYLVRGIVQHLAGTAQPTGPETGAAPAATGTADALRAVANNTATQQQIDDLVSQGLARVVQGQPVITDAGLATMPEADRPRLTEAQRVAEIEQEQTTEPEPAPASELEALAENARKAQERIRKVQEARRAAREKLGAVPNIREQAEADAELTKAYLDFGGAILKLNYVKFKVWAREFVKAFGNDIAALRAARRIYRMLRDGSATGGREVSDDIRSRMDSEETLRRTVLEDTPEGAGLGVFGSENNMMDWLANSQFFDDNTGRFHKVYLDAPEADLTETSYAIVYVDRDGNVKPTGDRVTRRDDGVWEFGFRYRPEAKKDRMGLYRSAVVGSFNEGVSDGSSVARATENAAARRQVRLTRDYPLDEFGRYTLYDYNDAVRWAGSVRFVNPDGTVNAVSAVAKADPDRGGDAASVFSIVITGTDREIAQFTKVGKLWVFGDGTEPTQGTKDLQARFRSLYEEAPRARSLLGQEEEVGPRATPAALQPETRKPIRISTAPAPREGTRKSEKILYRTAEELEDFISAEHERLGHRPDYNTLTRSAAAVKIPRAGEKVTTAIRKAEMAFRAKYPAEKTEASKVKEIEDKNNFGRPKAPFRVGEDNKIIGPVFTNDTRLTAVQINMGFYPTIPDYISDAEVHPNIAFTVDDISGKRVVVSSKDASSLASGVTVMQPGDHKAARQSDPIVIQSSSEKLMSEAAIVDYTAAALSRVEGLPPYIPTNPQGERMQRAVEIRGTTQFLPLTEEDIYNDVLRRNFKAQNPDLYDPAIAQSFTAALIFEQGRLLGVRQILEEVGYAKNGFVNTKKYNEAVAAVKKYLNDNYARYDEAKKARREAGSSTASIPFIRRVANTTSDAEWLDDIIKRAANAQLLRSADGKVNIGAYWKRANARLRQRFITRKNSGARPEAYVQLLEERDVDLDNINDDESIVAQYLIEKGSTSADMQALEEELRQADLTEKSELELAEEAAAAAAEAPPVERDLFGAVLTGKAPEYEGELTELTEDERPVDEPTDEPEPLYQVPVAQPRDFEEETEVAAPTIRWSPSVLTRTHRLQRATFLQAVADLPVDRVNRVTAAQNAAPLVQFMRVYNDLRNGLIRAGLLTRGETPTLTRMLELAHSNPVSLDKAAQQLRTDLSYAQMSTLDKLFRAFGAAKFVPATAQEAATVIEALGIVPGDPTSIVAVIDNIINNPEFPAEFRLLASRMRNLSGTQTLRGLTTIPTRYFRGAYDYNRHTINVSPSSTLNDTALTLLHELAHANVEQAMRDIEAGTAPADIVKAFNDLDVLRKEAAARASSSMGAYRANFEYYLSDTHEFIAGLMSDPSFNAWMSTQDASFVKRVWNKILELLGLRAAEGSPLERAWLSINSLTERPNLFAQSAEQISAQAFEVLLWEDDKRAKQMVAQRAGTRAMYAGPRAQMDQFRQDSLDAARAMAADGKTSEQIRAATGWFPGLDGKMRWEIPDNEASFGSREQFREAATKAFGGEVYTTLTIQGISDRLASGKYLKLGDVLKHPALFAAYPEAADIPFFPRGGTVQQGSFRTIGNRPVITASMVLDENQQINKESLATVLHEVQHFIQSKEGFARGGSPDNLITRQDIADAASFRDAYRGLNKYRKELATVTRLLAAERQKTGFLGIGGPSKRTIAGLDEEIKNLTKSINAIWENQKRTLSIDEGSTRATLLAAINKVDDTLGSAWVLNDRNRGLDMLYRMLAGEVESRDVEARLDMTEEQRKAVAPYSSQNIDPEFVIVRGVEIGTVEAKGGRLANLIVDEDWMDNFTDQIVDMARRFAPEGSKIYYNYVSSEEEAELAQTGRLPSPAYYDVDADGIVLNANIIARMAANMDRVSLASLVKTIVMHEAIHRADVTSTDIAEIDEFADAMTDEQWSWIIDTYHSGRQDVYSVIFDDADTSEDRRLLRRKTALEYRRALFEMATRGETTEQFQIFAYSNPSLAAHVMRFFKRTLNRLSYMLNIGGKYDAIVSDVRRIQQQMDEMLENTAVKDELNKIESLEFSASGVLKSIGGVELGGIPLLNKAYGTYKAGGWMTLGRQNKEFAEASRTRDAKLRAMDARVQQLRDDLDSVIRTDYTKKGLPAPVDLINDALGTTDNPISDKQREAGERMYARRLERAMSTFMSEQNRAQQQQNPADAALIREEARKKLKADLKAGRALRAKYFARAEQNFVTQVRQRQQAALLALTPDVARAVTTIRDDINAQQDALLAGGFLHPKTAARISRSRGVYLTRSYRILDEQFRTFDGVVRNRWVEFVRGNSPEAKLIYDQAAAYVAEEMVQEEALRIFKENQRARTPAGPFASDAERIAAYQAAAAANPKITMADATARAKAAFTPTSEALATRVEQYLELGLTELSQTDVLKRRDNIPAALQILWGVYEDNQFNAYNTLQKINAVASTRKMFNELYNHGKANGYIRDAVFRLPDGSLAVPLAGAGTREGKNRYGILAGTYGPKILADALRETMGNQASHSSVWNALRAATGYAMATKTKYSLQSTARNFLGNIAFILVNGSASVSGARQAIGVVARQTNLLSQDKTRFDAYIKNLIELRVLSESPYEFRELVKEMSDQMLSTSAGARLTRSKVGKIVRWLDKKAGVLHQGADDFWKVVAFESERKRLKKWYPNLSDADLDKRAAEKVRATMPTYTEASFFIKKLRQQPVIAPFITFTGEMYRIIGGTMKVAAQEMRAGATVGERLHGARRLTWLTAMLTALPYVMASVAKYAFEAGEDDEDQQNPVAGTKAVQRFVYQYMRGSPLMRFKSTDANEQRFMDMGYLLPYDVVSKVFTSGAAAAADPTKAAGLEKAGAAIVTMAEAMIEPFTKEQILFGSLMQSYYNYNPAYDREIYRESDNGFEVASAVFRHIYQGGIEPGILRTGRLLMEGAAGTVRDGQRVTLRNELMTMMGMKVQTLLVDERFKRNTDLRKNDLGEETTRLSSPLIRNGTVTENEIREGFQRMHETRISILREVRRDYLAALQLGVPTAAAKRVLRDSQLSNDEARAIISNIYVPNMVSEETLRKAKLMSLRHGDVDRLSIYLDEFKAYPKRQVLLPE